DGICMSFLPFAARNQKELIRDPLSIIFGIGLPVLLLLLISTIQAAWLTYQLKSSKSRTSHPESQCLACPLSHCSRAICLPMIAAVLSWHGCLLRPSLLVITLSAIQ